MDRLFVQEIDENKLQNILPDLLDKSEIRDMAAVVLRRLRRNLR